MVNGELVKFNYPEVVADHYIYRRKMEKHNELINDGGIKYQIGLESVWKMDWWPIQRSAFFIACTEVNAYLEMEYFLKKDYTFMNF